MSPTVDLLSSRLAEKHILVSNQVVNKAIVSEGGKLAVYGPNSYAPVATFGIHETDLASAVYDAIDGCVRPWHPIYLPRGLNETNAAKRHQVFAAGETVTGCVKGFIDSVAAGDSADVLEIFSETAEGLWQARFEAGGTSFRVSGICVPGGFILTDWT